MIARRALALLLVGGTAVAQPVTQPDYPPPPAPPRAEPKQQWLVLGAVTDPHGTLVGGHAALDAFVHGAWSLGLAGTYRQSGSDATTHSNATVYLAGTATLGPLLVRARVGAGVAFVDAGTTLNSSAMSIGGTTTSPIGEAALMAALPLGGDWLVLGGPVIDAAQAAPTNISLLAGLGRRF